MKRQTKRVSKYSLLLRTQGVGLKAYLAMQENGIKVLGLDAVQSQIQAKAQAKAKKEAQAKAEEERKARELVSYLLRKQEREARKEANARKEAQRTERRAKNKKQKEEREASIRKLSRKRLNSKTKFNRMVKQMKKKATGRKVALPTGPTLKERMAETKKFKAVQQKRRKQKLQAKIAEISGDWRLACKLMMLEGVA